MINCEVELNLLWTESCALVLHHSSITCVDFKITVTKLYVPLVNLYINDNIKVLKSLKQGFNRTVSRNKYRYRQYVDKIDLKQQYHQKNNMDYMIVQHLRILIG